MDLSPSRTPKIVSLLGSVRLEAIGYVVSSVLWNLRLVVNVEVVYPCHCVGWELVLYLLLEFEGRVQ